MENSELVAKILGKELESKMIRENEHFIQKLEHKSDNLTTNYKNLKTNLNKEKNENRKLIKKYSGLALTQEIERVHSYSCS